MTVGLTFNVYRVSSVSSSSSRQSQTSTGRTPAPASHGWLCCHACIVATSHPKTLRIFPGSCSFPSEASPSSSALVRSPRRRPPGLSTWSTTERNKDMTVHGEDDSRDPAAHAVILFFQDGEGCQMRCSGAVARLAHDQPSFFSFLKMASPAILFFVE